MLQRCVHKIICLLIYLFIYLFIYLIMSQTRVQLAAKVRVSWLSCGAIEVQLTANGHSVQYVDIPLPKSTVIGLHSVAS